MVLVDGKNSRISTQHIPTDALNLINHMKLHVNGKMADREKDRERDRKKREQESAEAMSGLKNIFYM